jgi:hypothetical protein
VLFLSEILKIAALVIPTIVFSSACFWAVHTLEKNDKIQKRKTKKA